MRRLIVWTAGAAVLCLAPPRFAAADEASDTKNADESFLEGRALLKDKRYADACPKFEQSQRQDPASGTLLALAYCQELSGLLATSWSTYLSAAQLAEREGRSDRQSAASERAQALAQRYSRITVVVPGELLSLPGLRLLRDGVEVERASFGVPVPTDGGVHVFLASAPGRVSWSSTVTLLVERDQKTLVLPVLDQVQPATTLTNPTLPTRAPPLANSGSAPDKRLTLERASLGFAAASVIGFGIGTAFALSAVSRNEASNDNGHCDSRGCDASGVDLRNSALSAARASAWSFVASGALAACSITLYIGARSVGATPSPTARVQSSVSLGAPSVTLSGSF